MMGATGDEGIDGLAAFCGPDQTNGVPVGERVEQGQPIAEVGATGRVTGAHLDWRMSWRKQRIDPQLLVPPMPKP